MTPAKIKRSWTSGEKLLAGTIIAAVVISSAVAWFLNDRDADPDVHIPTPTLPKPNGYDYFVAAGKAAVDSPLTVGLSLGPVPRPAKLNFTDPGTKSAANALMQQNKEAFRLLRVAVHIPSYTPPDRSNDDDSFPASEFRTLTRLLAFRARFNAARGNGQGAVDSGLDSVEMGEKILAGGPEMAFLTRNMCGTLGRLPLWECLGTLNAPGCRNGVQRLEKIESQRVPLTRVLQEQEWTEQAYLMEAFHKNQWKKAVIEMGGAGDYASPWRRRSINVPQLRYNMWLALVSKKRIMADYTARRDADIAAARRPYGTKPAPAPPDPLTDDFFMFSSQVRFLDAKNDAENRLLTVAMALRAYRLERGHYPASLSQLVPSYLSVVPTDPFTDQLPLKYIPTPHDKYVLYSVGPDMRDDGGAPIVSIRPNGKANHNVQLESRGDIVARVNE